jgi:hypothetical protein
MLRSLALVLLLALFATASAQAQSRHTVTGVVADSSGTTLVGATVVLMQRADSVMTGFAATDAQGAFAIRRAPSGAYLLQVTFVGFATHTQPVDVVDGPVDVGTITMRTTDQELGTLFVTAERTPLVLKGDTIDFNAAAFQVAPGSTVEDLLKRLPGVEVDRDGSVTAQGEQVQRVLVDGKEFFGSDPTVATRNLPADAVERVQVYDRQSEAAEFTGVDDGQQARTINLALKEDRRNGAFGNVSGGAGAASAASASTAGAQPMRYDGSASLNRFSPSARLSLLASVNNVNRRGFGLRDYISFGGGMGGFGGGRGGMVNIRADDQEADGFVATTTGGVNLNRDWGATELNASYFGAYSDSQRDRAVLQQRLVGDGRTAALSEDTDQGTIDHSHRMALQLEHEFSDGHDLELEANGSLTATDGSLLDDRRTSRPDGTLENDRLASTDLDGGTFSGDAELTYRRRFEGRRSLVARAGYQRSRSDRDEDIAALTRFYQNGALLTTDEVAQIESDLNTSYRTNASLLGTQRFGGGLSLQLSGEYRRLGSDRDREVIGLGTGAPVLDPRLSSQFDQFTEFCVVGAQLQKGTDDRQVSIGVDLQSAHLEGQTVGVGERVDQTYLRVLPNARFSQSMGQGRNLRVSYRTSTREPSVRELQPVVDNRDPLNVYIGNPNLRPAYDHNVSATYLHFDSFSFTNLFARASASYTPTAISTSRVVDERFRQTTTPVNVGGAWTLNANVNYGTPLRALRTKVDVSASTFYRRSVELLNGAENASDLARTGLSVSVENQRQTVADVRVGARYTWNTSAYELSPEFDRSYLSRTFFGEAGVNLGKGWRAETSLDLELYPDDVFGSAQQVPLWQAELSKEVGSRIQVQLVGMDLLNQGLGISYSDTGSFVQEERVDSLGRYVLLKLTYRLTPGGQSGGPRIQRF